MPKHQLSLLLTRAILKFQRLKSRIGRRFVRLSNHRIGSLIRLILQKHRPGVEILTKAPDDDSSSLEWSIFQHAIVFGGQSFRLQVGPATLEIPPLTACDLEQLRKSATIGDVGQWMRGKFRATGVLSRLVARTIGIESLLYNYAPAQAVSESAAELWKLNMAVKKKMLVFGPNAAPSSVLRELLTLSCSNVVFDVWDLEIIGEE